MAFVEIYKGTNILKVSKNAFEKQFKPIGYRLLKKRRQPEPEYEYEEEEGQGQEPDIDSIPISDMNQKQLKEYASKHNINISGANSVKDARRMIQKYIQESKM